MVQLSRKKRIVSKKKTKMKQEKKDRVYFERLLARIDHPNHWLQPYILQQRHDLLPHMGSENKIKTAQVVWSGFTISTNINLTLMMGRKKKPQQGCTLTQSNRINRPQRFAERKRRCPPGRLISAGVIFFRLMVWLTQARPINTLRR